MALGTTANLEGVEGAGPDFIHTGPGTLAGRYMRTFWHPVMVATDLAAGRSAPIKIMSEDLTLYRGESGKVHAVAFRCAHRGTQLSTGWVEGDNLRCFYHGWMYGPDGQCVEQPAEPEPFCQRIKIRSYPVQEYLGLIFLYQGEGEPPPLPRYRAFERDGLLVPNKYVRGCNFFNNIDNDPVHVAFVHRQFWADGLPVLHAAETDYGIDHTATYADGRVERGNPHLIPNISYRVQNSDRRDGPSPGRPGGYRPEGTSGQRIDAIAWRIPIDDESHLALGVDLVHVSGKAADEYLERAAARAAAETVPVEKLGEDVLAGQFGDWRREIDWETTDTTLVQDWVVQVGQGRIYDRRRDHLGRSDAPVILERRIWERELTALAAGRPLKQWVPPDE
jgi:5,5'-dehydrodivanillate O-demethylase oxygenase subunit